jgi:hypothetical protein
VESFGGRVTSAVSGKTDILLVGKEPGMSKVGLCNLLLLLLAWFLYLSLPGLAGFLHLSSLALFYSSSSSSDGIAAPPTSL